MLVSQATVISGIFQEDRRLGRSLSVGTYAILLPKVGGDVSVLCPQVTRCPKLGNT